MTTETKVLEAIEVSCVRGDRPLFRPLSFSLASGELLHIRGHNGRGKTTLLRSLCGLSLPANGEIRWQGQAIRALDEDYGQYLAYIGHLNALQAELSAWENLRASTCLHLCTTTTSAIGEALAYVGLEAVSALSTKALSQGQKRRLALARLLLLAKPLWILDEPFTSLDVQSIRIIANLLTRHLTQGGMVVMASHQELPLGQASRQIDLDA